MKDLLTNSEEVRIDPTTQTLQTAVDTVSTQTIVPHGNYLLLHINHEKDPIKEAPTSHRIINKPPTANTTTTDSFANQQIILKNYQTQQKSFNNLVQYLKITIDPETGQKIYILYYQLYNKKKDQYDYYKYTPEGFKKIPKKTFFEQSKSKEVHFLVYKKINITPFSHPIPWIENKRLKQLQNIGVGALATFAIIAGIQLGKKPNVIHIQATDEEQKEQEEKKEQKEQEEKKEQKEQEEKKEQEEQEEKKEQEEQEDQNQPKNTNDSNSNFNGTPNSDPGGNFGNSNSDSDSDGTTKRISGQENNGGLENIGNTCYFNASIQALDEIWPNYYKKIVKADIKEAVVAMRNSMERGRKGKDGSSKEEMYAVRKALNKYRAMDNMPYWEYDTLQHDPHEFIMRFNDTLSRKNEEINDNLKSTLVTNSYSLKTITEGKLGLTKDNKNPTFKNQVYTKDFSGKLRKDFMLSLHFPPDKSEDNKSISLQQMLTLYESKEDLTGDEMLRKDWDEFLKAFEIDLNDQNWKPSEELKNYLLLNDYQQLISELDNTEAYKSVLDTTKEALNDGDFRDILSSFTNEFTNTDITALQEKLKSYKEFLNDLNKSTKLSDIIFILNSDKDENLRDLLLQTIKEKTLNSKATSKVRSLLEKGKKLYKLIKDKNLLNGNQDTHLPKKDYMKTMQKKAIKFFTDKGFDEKEVTEKFDNHHIRLYIGNNDNLEVYIYHEGNQRETIEFDPTQGAAIAIELARFKRQKEENNEDDTKKINTKVTGIMQLNLPAYMVNGNKETRLPLQAAIFHSGKSATSGHYQAFRKDNGQWWLCNDSSMKKVTPEIVKKTLIGDGKYESAYILFYKKPTPSTAK